LICDELEVAFKPRITFTADLGRYAMKEDSGSKWWCAGMPEEGENENAKWITVTGNGKTKKLLKPKLEPKLHNAFAILSQPNAPTIYNMSGPALQMDNNKTIIPPNPREHRRQQKIARGQHIKQMLRRLHDSDNLFLDSSITLAEDEWTSLAKNDTSNKNVRQSTQPTPSVTHQALGLPNGDATLHTVWALHSIGRLKRSTRTST
jgi:hypothetical protein